MRIARFAINGDVRHGSVELPEDGTAHPDTVVEFTADPITGPAALTDVRHALSDVRLLTPVRPSKVVGLARNYSPDRDPDPPAAGAAPQVFLKPADSVIDPGSPIVIPALSHDTGLEGELVVVIGRTCKDVPVAGVEDVIAGYSIVNDVTARDFFVDNVPWGLAKGFDSFTPIGPWVVTGIPLAKASDTAITTSVDGKIIQQGTTRRLLWSIANQVSYLSRVMTLRAGDVILSGTPAGACQIHAGETVTIEVEGVGTLTNPVVAQ